jgi:hypothetical protein
MQHLLDILKTLDSILILLAPVLLVFVQRWVKNDAHAKAIGNAVNLTRIFVGEADAIARDLKNPDKPATGDWTAADGARLKSAVLAKLRGTLQREIPILTERLARGQSLEDFFNSLVEAEVTRLKKPPALATPATTGAATPSSP